MHYTGPGTSTPFKVGPDGEGGYRYMIGGQLSAAVYHNAESARHAARRPQRLTPARLAPPKR